MREGRWRKEGEGGKMKEGRKEGLEASQSPLAERNEGTKEERKG